jgi:hypothetical protein
MKAAGSEVWSAPRSAAARPPKAGRNCGRCSGKGHARLWSSEKNRRVAEKAAYIDKHLADRARKAAALPEKKSEAEVETSLRRSAAAGTGSANASFSTGCVRSCGMS